MLPAGHTRSANACVAPRMNGQDDVSWPVVERVVRDSLGQDARLYEICFLSSGIVSSTLALRIRGGERAVLKISPHRANFAHAREAEALAALRSLGLPVPAVLAVHTASLESPHSYLLIKYIDGATMRETRRRCSAEQWETLQRELAEMVVTIHAERGLHYGRVGGGESFGEWCAFYRTLVDPIWTAADRLACLPSRTRKTIARLHERLERYLSHGDSPRLCHGDLWGGNVMCHVDGDGNPHICALIDPDLRHGHAEAEIAYMDLFHTISPAFKQTYQQHFRLGDDYHARRKTIYQLYGLLNYLQLHGASHAGPVIAAAEKLAAIV